MATPSNGIPYVPEGTLDPAAGLNLALNTVDALLQAYVLDMDKTAPPASPSNGDMHIVASGATGAWAGKDHHLARYVATGGHWQYFAPGVQARLVFDQSTGRLYAWHDGSWQILAAV